MISCEAPFLIYRLHHIDFRCWAESEAAYQAGLDQICAAVAEAIQSRKSPERLLGAVASALGFTPFILEKRNHFTGRQWLFQDLDEWRSKEAPPALLITGEPGIGKSAIVAALVSDNPEGQVLAYHCCSADTPATLESARHASDAAQRQDDNYQKGDHIHARFIGNEQSNADREATFAGAPRAASTAMHQVVLAFGRFSGFDKFANVSFRTTRSNVYGFSAEYGPTSSFFGTIPFSDFADLTQSAKSLTAPETVLSDFTISHLNRT